MKITEINGIPNNLTKWMSQQPEQVQYNFHCFMQDPDRPKMTTATATYMAAQISQAHAYSEECQVVIDDYPNYLKGRNQRIEEMMEQQRQETAEIGALIDESLTREELAEIEEVLIKRLSLLKKIINNKNGDHTLMLLNQLKKVTL